MLQQLQELKGLVLSDEWDDESRQDVLDLEERLREVTARERLLETPAIAEYAAFLRSEIDRCRELLAEDESLTGEQRVKLHERKRSCREFLSRFDPSARAELEKTINDTLNAAKAR